MGSLYRSEEMRFCQLIVEKDAAFTCVAELGKHQCVQFKDLNPDVNPFQRIFVRDIRRFDEMERKLRFMEHQFTKDGMAGGGQLDDGDYTILPTADLNRLEATLSDLEKDIKNMNDNDALLKRNFADLKEWQYVLQKTDEFFAGGIDDQATMELYGEEEATAGGFITIKQEKLPIQYVVGVIERGRVTAFERVLWRACHHTAFVRTAEIDEELENPDNGEKVLKSVFIIFYKGDRLRNIINKVCEGFKAKLFANCPRTSKERQSSAVEVRARIQDLTTVIGQTRAHRQRVLQAAANNHNAWLKQVNMQKSVYQTLNLFTFDGIGRFFVAECWIPARDIDDVRIALEHATELTGSTVRPVLNILETAEEPPTYNKVNKFTAVFQSIVDSYGIASYLEVNPAPYTIITFPFLFSCMFGDLGHGILMFLAGLFLVVREKNLIARNIKDEIFGMFFGGRYIILLMGLFSIHAGFIYNDSFAKSFNIFGSSWRNPYNHSQIDHWLEEEERSKKDLLFELPPGKAYQPDLGPYPFGVDPIWNIAENRLNFLNSMKMKLSVILGIGQMTFGVFLSLQNHRFFKSKIDIFTVFIPQLLFLGCIFMYLCLQIIIKWIFFWVKEDVIFGNVYPGSHCAPSLLIGLINMFMFKTREPGFVRNVTAGRPAEGWKELDGCYLTQWYPGQSSVEAVLVLIALVCVPIMLFGKPIQFIMQQKKHKTAAAENITVSANVLSEEVVIPANGGSNGVSKKEEEHGGGGGGGAHHGENFGDVMVHQAIHTIEFVLGCVSHTASYLRLWALSLAHAQLSEVLWHMVLANAFGFSDKWLGAVAIYIVFFFFGVLTFSILVLMEGLSAFLHALRLHWVEFQSKFYLGLGYPFQPFSFKGRLQEIEASAPPTS